MHSVLLGMNGFTIYTYGLFAAAAMLTVFWMASFLAPRQGIDRAAATDLVFFLFVAGVIGSRFFFVAQHWADYEGHFWDVFSLREGGLVWYGGFITAASLGLIVASWNRWPILKLCDFFAPLVAMGHGIGRLGCFFNGCCYGRPTDSPLGVFFEGHSHARLPVQLFEAAALFLLALFLYRRNRRRHTEGSTFLLYVLLYAFTRFGLEFLRGDQRPVAWLTAPQWTSLLLIAGAAFLGIYLRRQKGR